MTKTAKKILIWSTIGILIFLLLAVGIFTAVFTVKTPDFAPSSLTDKDIFFGAKFTQNVLFQALKSKKQNELKVIRISNEEMKSAVKLAENGDSILYLITGIKPEKKSNSNFYKIKYDSGIYTFTVKLTDSFISRCFAADGIASVKYDNGKMDIDFISLKLGKIELPQKYKDKAEKYILSSLKNEPVYNIFRTSVKKIEYFENGNVKIYYYPYRLRKHISKLSL